MKKEAKIVTAVFVALMVTSTLGYAISKNLLTLPTDGEVVSAEMTGTPSTIQWGKFVEGTMISKQVNVENVGGTDINDLHLTYVLPTDFVGSLTWNLEGASITIGETKQATFNLTVTDAPLGPFSFDITILGDC